MINTPIEQKQNDANPEPDRSLSVGAEGSGGAKATNDAPTSYSCPFCPAMHPSFELLDSHVETIHANIISNARKLGKAVSHILIESYEDPLGYIVLPLSDYSPEEMKLLKGAIKEKEQIRIPISKNKEIVELILSKVIEDIPIVEWLNFGARRR